MVNSKDKGSRWERDAVKILEELIDNSEFKRVPGSGAFGSLLHNSNLVGDIVGSLPNIKNKLKIECKVGYGQGQMSIKKEWLDKIKEEALQDLSIPMLFCKFDGARSGVKYFVVMDIESFSKLINLYSSKLE